LASAGLNYGRLGLRPEVALRAFGFLGPKGFRIWYRSVSIGVFIGSHGGSSD